MGKIAEIKRCYAVIRSDGHAISIHDTSAEAADRVMERTNKEIKGRTYEYVVVAYTDEYTDEDYQTI